MGKIKKSPLIIFALAVAVFYVLIYVLPKISGALQPSYTAEYGELKVSDSTEGYFVRNEFVYFTKSSGEENTYIKNDTLVRKGTRIMEVIPNQGTYQVKHKTSKEGLGTYQRFRRNIKGEHHIDTDDCVTEHEGILAYNADGYESMLTPDNMDKKDKTFFKLLSNNDNIDLRREEVLVTDPLFKICDRSEWYIICYVPRDSEQRYKVGSRVTVEIADNAEIVGKIYKVADERREKRLTIKTNHYFKNFTTLRKADIRVVTSSVMGLLISNSSIVEKDGKQGVFVRQKTGKYKFVRISVIATDGKKSAIYESRFRDAKGKSISTVRSYDDVLRRPSKDRVKMG